MSTFKIDNEQINSSVETLRSLLEECEEAYNKTIPESTQDKGNTHDELSELCNNLKITCFYLGELINNSILFLGKSSDMFEKSDKDSATAISGGDSLSGASQGENTNNGQSQTLSAYDKYSKDTTRITKKVPIGQKQEKERSGSGLCTYSATTTLLQRKQAYENKDVTFTFSDVHRASGGTGVVDADGIWPDSQYLFGNTYTSKDGVSYKMTYKEGHTNKDEMVKYLNEHPEGIMVYSPSYGGYNHAMIITDYELREDGGIQFYADDPVNNQSSNWPDGRVPIEKTWFYSQNPNIFETAVRISYF